MLKPVIWDELFRHAQDLTRSPYMHILFWVIVVDIVTGYIKAFKLKRFDSRTGTNGMIRHILVFAVMSVAGTYLRFFGLPNISIALCSFFILNYVGSLMENWEAMGLPFPEQLKPYINQLRKEQDKKLVQTLKVDKLEITNEVKEDGNKK